MMDPVSLQAALEQAGVAALAMGLLAGFLFSFNPVALAAIPVSLGYVAKAGERAWGAFGLGAPFSVAVCPVCTPTLLIMLGVSAAIGSALYGLALLMAFALGRALPILVGAVAIGWLERMKPLRAAQKSFERVGGIVLILAGLYMLNAYFIFIPALA